LIGEASAGKNFSSVSQLTESAPAVVASMDVSHYFRAVATTDIIS